MSLATFFSWSLDAVIYDSLVLVTTLLVGVVFLSLVVGKHRRAERNGDQGWGFDE